MRTNECRCGRPTRDAAYVCDQCSDDLGRALGDVPWLDEQLEITITGQRATTYDGAPSRGAERPSPVHWGASEARAHLRALLVSWTLFCDAEGVRSTDPRPGLPSDNLPALSRWLLWRVDGLALHDIGSEVVEEITSAVAHCHRVIDRRPDRWFAGPCDECGTDLYAVRRVGDVGCETCGATYDVTARREWLLAEAEDRLAPASEVARAVSWLGAQPLTADRVRQWASRGLILPRHTEDGRPLYRVGDAIDVLARVASGT